MGLVAGLDAGGLDAGLDAGLGLGLGAGRFANRAPWATVHADTIERRVDWRAAQGLTIAHQGRQGRQGKIKAPLRHSPAALKSAGSSPLTHD